MKNALNQIKSFLPNGTELEKQTTLSNDHLNLSVTERPLKPVLNRRELSALKIRLRSLNDTPLSFRRYYNSLGMTKFYRGKQSLPLLYQGYMDFLEHLEILDVRVYRDRELDAIHSDFYNALSNYEYGRNNGPDQSEFLNRLEEWSKVSKPLLEYQDDVIHDAPKRGTESIPTRNCQFVHINRFELEESVDKLLDNLNLANYQAYRSSALARLIKNKCKLIETYENNMERYQKKLDYYENWSNNVKYDTTGDLEEHLGKKSYRNVLRQEQPVRDYKKQAFDTRDEWRAGMDEYNIYNDARTRLVIDRMPNDKI